MFKDNFIRLCNEKGESPSSVCRKVGITPASFSQWTEDTVPRQSTLVKIADYFGVTADVLLIEGVENDAFSSFVSETARESTGFWDVYTNLCYQKGLSPNAVAKILSISSGTVTSWKNGAIPHDTTQRKIADYFGVSRGYLVGKNDDISFNNRGGCVENESSILEEFLEILPNLSKKDLLKVNLKIAELLLKKN
jgi:transcriptional regulator with XRE-family HTH domain